MPNSEDIFRLELSLLEERCFPYQDFYLESESGFHLGESLRKFIQGIKDMLLKAVRTFSDKIQGKFKEKETQESLNRVRKACKSAQGKGIATVECYDVFSYQKILKDTIKQLDKIITKYVNGYNRSGKGLAATDKMVDEVNRIIGESDRKLKKIKEKKVPVKTEKLLNWIDSQIGKGNKGLFDFAYEYLGKLDEYMKIVDTYDKKADEFAEKNKVYRRPKGFNQGLTNASAFVKRNIDWIGKFGLAIGSLWTGLVFDQLSIQKNTERHNTEVDFGDRGNGSLLKSPQANEKRGNLETKEQYGEKKRHNVATVAGAVTAITTPIASTNLLKARHEKRNSI